MSERLETYYGLPGDVQFCKRCVMSNQKPNSFPEFRHQPNRQVRTIHFNEDGLCDACKFADKKHEIDYDERERQFLALLDKHRKENGNYDCIVPGSGGKDSAYVSHLMKYKYGMHPLTVTWPPTLYTDYGYRNYTNWLKIGGFDNLPFRPNPQVHKLLTRLSIENLLHPFQTFILGQRQYAIKIALLYDIPLVMYGEGGIEYGQPIAESTTSRKDNSHITTSDITGTYFGGASFSELKEVHGLTINDLLPYLPADPQRIEAAKIEVHNMGYYIKWIPQEAYYYAVENCGFEARPFRTDGTYNKYSSIDDKIDDLHYYTTHIKFGIGRTTYDASQEIRNNHLTREEGVSLVDQFDGEFPQRYFQDVMDYIDMNPEYFMELCDKFRSPHLWKLENGQWQLRHHVS